MSLKVLFAMTSGSPALFLGSEEAGYLGVRQFTISDFIIASIT
jgi:hypothetical protein